MAHNQHTDVYIEHVVYISRYCPTIPPPRALSGNTKKKPKSTRRKQCCNNNNKKVQKQESHNPQICSPKIQEICVVNSYNNNQRDGLGPGRRGSVKQCSKESSFARSLSCPDQDPSPSVIIVPWPLAVQPQSMRKFHKLRSVRQDPKLHPDSHTSLARPLAATSHYHLAPRCSRAAAALVTVRRLLVLAALDDKVGHDLNVIGRVPPEGE